MALTIVRSLGQAFDVCHKLNPKPKKKKGTTAETATEGGAGSADKEGAAKKKEGDEGEDEEVVKEDLGSASTTATEPGGAPPSSWKQFNTDLDSALQEGGGGAGSTQEDKAMADLNKDLMQLNFDPFSVPLNMPPLANGNPLSMDPFQPVLPGVGGASGPVAYPPLTVSNLSTSLPDFPEGVDPATASAGVPPPHMAILGRPRPRPSLSGQQVRSVA